MRGHRKALLGLAVLTVLVLPAMLPVGVSSHQLRIVWPYGVDERWVPILAGYKVVPNPPQCDTGTGAGNSIFFTDFESGNPFSPAPFTKWHRTNWLSDSLWHVTTVGARGTDTGHSQPNRLYFGHDSTGMYKTGGLRTAGVMESPPLEVPLVGSWYISFATKWETEWLEGYDHMWVEVRDQAGEVYILCTLNPEGRGDSSSSDTITAGSCSPYHVGFCPASARQFDFLGLVSDLDPAAPHWESRYVQIPPIFNGQTIQFRFTWDTADGVANTFLGWMVDDVRVSDVAVPGVEVPPILGLGS